MEILYKSALVEILHKSALVDILQKSALVDILQKSALVEIMYKSALVEILHKSALVEILQKSALVEKIALYQRLGLIQQSKLKKEVGLFLHNTNLTKQNKDKFPFVWSLQSLTEKKLKKIFFIN